MRLGEIVQIVLSALGFVLSLALYCTSLGAVFNGLTAAAFLGLGLAVSAGAVFLNRIG